MKEKKRSHSWRLSSGRLDLSVPFPFFSPGKLPTESCKSLWAGFSGESLQLEMGQSKLSKIGGGLNQICSLLLHRWKLQRIGKSSLPPSLKAWAPNMVCSPLSLGHPSIFFFFSIFFLLCDWLGIIQMHKKMMTSFLLLFVPFRPPFTFRQKRNLSTVSTPSFFFCGCCWSCPVWFWTAVYPSFFFFFFFPFWKFTLALFGRASSHNRGGCTCLKTFSAFILTYWEWKQRWSWSWRKSHHSQKRRVRKVSCQMPSKLLLWAERRCATLILLPLSKDLHSIPSSFFSALLPEFFPPWPNVRGHSAAYLRCNPEILE